MIQKYACLMILLLLVSCSQEKNTDNKLHESYVFDKEKTYIALYEDANTSVFTIQYQLTNVSKEDLLSSYILFNFHDDILEVLLLNHESYSPYKRLGGAENIVSLKSGETTQGSVSLEVKVDVGIELDELKETIEDSDSVQIQLLDTESDNVLASLWIHRFQAISE
ncbi:hypothetical protein [Marinicrinis lubricantis]|uniref:Uncharacterized protein n=1 Tax=Marinicrinis lubricantis TaxID=2086470 RepID=A0ABW1IM07_9BACL